MNKMYACEHKNDPKGQLMDKELISHKNSL